MITNSYLSLKQLIPIHTIVIFFTDRKLITHLENKSAVTVLTKKAAPIRSDPVPDIPWTVIFCNINSSFFNSIK